LITLALARTFRAAGSSTGCHSPELFGGGSDGCGCRRARCHKPCPICPIRCSRRSPRAKFALASRRKLSPWTWRA